jgi:hypothetical protein
MESNEEPMWTWEHEFAYVVNGQVVDLLPSTGVGTAARPHGWEFPMNVEMYISRMSEQAEHFDFCGSYPRLNGCVIVMKRKRTGF